mmetsp:Transcript_9289/g.26089  ORF Transcript_9289/g.26089 Transcript_9289/m.26089 type:complete len:216 (-) Transcript_9289:565-1212(-)
MDAATHAPGARSERRVPGHEASCVATRRVHGKCRAGVESVPSNPEDEHAHCLHVVTTNKFLRVPLAAVEPSWPTAFRFLERGLLLRLVVRALAGHAHRLTRQLQQSEGLLLLPGGQLPQLTCLRLCLLLLLRYLRLPMLLGHSATAEIFIHLLERVLPRVLQRVLLWLRAQDAPSHQSTAYEGSTASGEVHHAAASKIVVSVAFMKAFLELARKQ